MRTLYTLSWLVLASCVSDATVATDGGGLAEAGVDASTPTTDAPSDTSTTNDANVDAGLVDAGTFCDGIVGWWTGDDTLADKKMMNHLTAQSPLYNPGKVKAGIYIPNGYANTAGKPSATGLSALPELTIEAWISIQGGTIGDIVAFNGAGANTFNGWYLQTDVSRYVYFGIAGLGVLKSLSQVPATGLNHVAATYTPMGNNNMRVYINGSPVGAATHNGASTPSPNNPRIRIGASADSDKELWIGVADEVTIYKRALTSTEIAGIFTAGAAGKCL